MKTAALIVAAGRGSRLGGDIPKQYLNVAGRPLLAHTLEVFLQVPEIDRIRVVIHPDDVNRYNEAAAACRSSRLGLPVFGGATRQDSVRLGLEALGADCPDRVFIHDAARPFVSPKSLAHLLKALQDQPAAVLATPVFDTLKRGGSDGLITATQPRDGLWRAQTPQAFNFQQILDAHRRVHALGRADFTDDSQIAEWAGIPVALVAGSEENFKVTSAEDLNRAERLLLSRLGDVRTGTGFDVHRFTDGDHVWLCGVRIPHTHKLEGHSDADVGLHALTDAILGALGDGDIGQHFPPSDPKWKGAASHLFLRDAARRVRERGGVIANADVTLLCEAPRVGPHREAMRRAIGEILGLDAGRVGVKATTTEGLGFTGRREGIAAMASATLRLP